MSRTLEQKVPHCTKGVKVFGEKRNQRFNPEFALSKVGYYLDLSVDTLSSLHLLLCILDLCDLLLTLAASMSRVYRSTHEATMRRPRAPFGVNL